MRNAAEIKDLILTIARQDDRIRAVLLNGSRANPLAKPDRWQDFDIVFVVDRLETFLEDHSWTIVFGDKIIWQLPDDMSFGTKDKPEQKSRFAYLMLFTDKNRIDLTLVARESISSNDHLDSLTVIWHDKDGLFSSAPLPSDRDYHIKKPTEKQFLDTSNEFWWVSTYVAKGLLRGELTYAKEMMETTVRLMFMRLIEWKIGIEQDFRVSFGKAGKHMPQFVTDDFYQKVLETYANHTKEENWRALLLMARLFSELSDFVGSALKFQINKTEERNTLTYLEEQRNAPDQLYDK